MRLCQVDYRSSLLIKLLLAIISALLYLIPTPGAVAAPSKTDNQEFSTKQGVKNRTVVVGMLQDGWPPFEINGMRGPSGLSLEYLTYIGQRLRINWFFKSYETWPDLYRAACRGEVDLVMSVTPSDERRKCLEFTSTYFQAEPVVVSRRDTSATQDLSIRGGRRIAVAREFVFTDILKRQFPDATYLEVAGPKEGLIAVSEGRADLFITNPFTARYLIGTERVTNLRLAASAPVPFSTLSFAGPKRSLLLLESMSGVINGMSSLQHAHMRERWISSHDTEEEALTLTDADRQYVGAIGNIKVAYLSNRSPVSFTDSFEQANGYGPSMLRSVAGQLGLTLDFVPVKSASDVRKLISQHKVDIVVGLSNTDSLAPKLLPSIPYSTFPIVVAMRSDAQTVSTASEIQGMRILVSEGTQAAIRGYMRASGVDARSINDADSGMSKVANGDADAYVDNLLVIDHFLQRSYSGELKIAGAPRERDELGFLVSSEKPRLLALIDRTLEAMPSSQQEAIRSRWTTRQPGEDVSLRLLWREFGAAIVAIAVGLALLVLWQVRLQRAASRNHRLQELLAQRADFQQAVIDASPHPLLGVGTDGSVLALNSAYREEFGERVMDAGPFSALKEELDVKGREVVYLDNNGCQRIGLYWQLTVDGRSGIPGRVASLVDVTPLRHAEHVTRLTQLRLAELTRNFPGAVYQYRSVSGSSIAFVYVAGNPQAMFGLTAEEMIGSELKARNAVHPDDREQLIAAVLDAIDEHRPLLIEFRTVVGGITHWIRSHAVPSTQSDGSTLWSGYWIDVTDIHAYQEELAEAMRVAEQAVLAKGRFLAVMSHEIRTPMSGVLGLLDSLSRTPLNAEQRYLTALMSESAETLSKVIHDVLDFTKLEEGQAELDLSDVDLVDLIEGVVSSTIVVASDKVKFRIVADANLAPFHLADETRIRQVLTNLIANAIKFTEEGEIVLAIRAEGSHEHRQYITIEIRDTGIGIATEVLGDLFEPFSQANERIHTRYGGSGLGLSICRHLARLMGGDVSLTSTEGVGTKAALHLELPMSLMSERAMQLENLSFFTEAEGAPIQEVIAALTSLGAERKLDRAEADFILSDQAEADPEEPLLIVSNERLPGGHRFLQQCVVLSANPLTRRSTFAAVQYLMCGITPAAQITPTLAGTEHDRVVVDHQPIQELTRSKGHVLVVEDHFVNGELMKHQLRLIGYSCDLVDGGEAALSALQTASYSAVITDCQMEPLSGYEWVSRFRALEGKTVGRLPIIAISAAPAGLDERWKEAGMDHYFSRPIQLDTLARALQGSGRQGSQQHGDEVPSERPLGEVFDELTAVTGGRQPAMTLLQGVLASTRADTEALKMSEFSSVGRALAAWLHTTVGALRLLGHSRLTTSAGELEINLVERPTLGTIAEMADLAADIEDWLEELEEFLASLGEEER